MTEIIRAGLVLTFMFCLFYLTFFVFATADLMDKRHKLKCPITNQRNVDMVFPVRPFACWLIKPQEETK